MNPMYLKLHYLHSHHLLRSNPRSPMFLIIHLLPMSPTFPKLPILHYYHLFRYHHYHR
jgi:hypothetical protein